MSLKIVTQSDSFQIDKEIVFQRILEKERFVYLSVTRKLDRKIKEAADWVSNPYIKLTNHRGRLLPFYREAKYAIAQQLLARIIPNIFAMRGWEVHVGSSNSYPLDVPKTIPLLVGVKLTEKHFASSTIFTDIPLPDFPVWRSQCRGGQWSFVNTRLGGDSQLIEDIIDEINFKIEKASDLNESTILQSDRFFDRDPIVRLTPHVIRMALNIPHVVSVAPSTYESE